MGIENIIGVEKEEIKFEVGEEAAYHDSGDIYKVRIKGFIDDHYKEGYELEILEVIKFNPKIGHLNAGLTFTCSKRKGVSNQGCWSLRKLR